MDLEILEVLGIGAVTGDRAYYSVREASIPFGLVREIAGLECGRHSGLFADWVSSARPLNMLDKVE